MREARLFASRMRGNVSDEEALRGFVRALGHDQIDVPDPVVALIEDIASESTASCDVCDGLTFTESRTASCETVHGTREMVCSSCGEDTPSCADCGRPMTSGVLVRTQVESGNSVCSGCYVEPDEDDEDDEDDDIEDRNVTLIHDYNTRVENKVNLGLTDPAGATGLHRSLPGENMPTNPRWLGVELEVVVRDDVEDLDEAARHAIRNVGAFAALKKDSSIGEEDEEGFEIVSLPGSINWHRKVWDKFLEDAPTYLKGWSAPTCGMHVHIDRASMSTLGIGKLLVFITDPVNVPFIERIAGRKGNEYTKYHKKKLSDLTLPNIGNENARYRRDAINLNTRSTGYQTMELRIFRSNVARDGFLKNLDFAHAACEFCDTAASVSPTIEQFINWMKEPRNIATYPFLARWLSDHGLFEHPNRKPKTMKRWSEGVVRLAKKNGEPITT